MEFKKVALVGKFARREGPFRRKLEKETPFKVVERNPDLVICYGGDGTFLNAERKFPGLPKLLIRDSEIGKKYKTHKFERIVDAVLEGDYDIEEFMKLEARIVRQGKTIKKFLSVNEVAIRNKRLTRALRFSVKIDRKWNDKQVIGDGAVVSTPFGSTGYYNSITRRPFKRGIGVAFNNPCDPKKSIILKKDSKVEFGIIREAAVCSSDNDPHIVTLKEGDRIVIKRSKDFAKILEIGGKKRVM